MRKREKKGRGAARSSLRRRQLKRLLQMPDFLMRSSRDVRSYCRLTNVELFTPFGAIGSSTLVSTGLCSILRVTERNCTNLAQVAELWDSPGGESGLRGAAAWPRYFACDVRRGHDLFWIFARAGSTNEGGRGAGGRCEVGVGASSHRATGPASIWRSRELGE